MTTLSPHARAMLSAIVASAAARDKDVADDELVALLSAENPDLDRLVSALSRTEGEAEAEAKGLADYITTLEARLSAFKQRAGNARMVLLEIMNAVGVRQWRRPEATIGWIAGKPGVVVIDEAAIPEQYFRVKRTVNISAIKEAMDEGEVIPGVAVANGTPFVRINRNPK